MNPTLLLQNLSDPSQTELLLVLLLALAALVVAWGLHWLTGRFRRRALQRLHLETEDAGFGTAASVQRLGIDWMARGVRLGIWLVLFIFVINLLPQEKDRFLSVRDKLLARLQQVDQFLVNHAIPAVLIAVVTIFLMRFAAALIKTIFELFEQRVAGVNAAASRRRAKTLSAITRGVVQAVIFLIGTMVLLQQVGISITPILASAGIVGIAVGFGAQSLVKDIFAGFLILLEEQYDVGDAVKIGETAGTVEHLTLRVTRIRALDGALTTIPNGSIVTVSNLSRDWSRAVLDVEVDYGEDVDRAMHIMLETAQLLRHEKPEEITDDPVMYGVDKIIGSNLVLRLGMMTAPTKQAEIARELRRRIKLAFDRAGIKASPGPQQLILSTPQRDPTSGQEKL